MFIELTNASEGYESTALAIQVDIITSVYESPSIKDEGKMSTFVFSFMTSQTWQVKESVSTVVKMLNKIQAK